MKFKVSSKNKSSNSNSNQAVHINLNNNNPEYSSPDKMMTNVPIPEMAALVIGNSAAINGQSSQLSNPSTNPPIQIPDTHQMKTTLSVVDESIPRQCDYLGSFEVRHFSNPEDRGNYITQQLYVICKQQDGDEQNSSQNSSGQLDSSNQSGDSANLNANIEIEPAGLESHEISASGSCISSRSAASMPECSSTSPSRNKSGQISQKSSETPKTWPVCLVLTIAGIKVCDPANLKNVLQMFALRRISFSTAIPALNVFAISAREPGSPHNIQYAHVFRTDNAEEINQIVGLAFKQAYTLEKPSSSGQGQSAVQTPLNKIPENLAKVRAANTPSTASVAVGQAYASIPPSSYSVQSVHSAPPHQMQRSKSSLTPSNVPKPPLKTQNSLANQVQVQQQIQATSNPSISKSFEQRVFSQIFANKNEGCGGSVESGQSAPGSGAGQSLNNLGGLNLLKRSKSFKKGTSALLGAFPGNHHVKDASAEFKMATKESSNQIKVQVQPLPQQSSDGREARPSLHHRTSSNVSNNSGSGITYSYSGNSKQTADVSGYQSNSLSSGSQNLGSLEKKNGNGNSQNSQNSNDTGPDFSKIAPQNQWHQPDLHPDTARDLLIKMPLGSFFIVGSRSPLNLMIRGESNIWQFGVVITNKGYHLLLNTKLRKLSPVPVFGSLVALIYHYSTIERSVNPLPTQLYHGYFKRVNLGGIVEGQE